MYLKRLELSGFKSFANKTRLEFEPGISAIIGPNGCGKSNISDSIRWCLGEKSARSMRSVQMQDVIFNGSQGRGTTGMAEVSLTFDNSQNILPINYSEVTITRRLFRSGESEYYINKAQCRLKDIRELFLDTGIGTEGYSFMEQGKVEFILSASAQERRELFEEAAGVSKYRVRREETLRKLDRVEIDTNRVNDMLAMLKEQITKLDAAARKARQFKKYKEDLKRLETASIIHKINNNKVELENIRTEVEPKKREYEELNTQCSQTEADISNFRVTQIEKDDYFVKIQGELSGMRSGIDLADERISQAKTREVELKERRENLKIDIENGLKEAEKLRGEFENINRIKSELTIEVERLNKEYLEKESEISSLRAKISDRSASENTNKVKLFDLAAEKTKLHNEKNRLISYHSVCHAKKESIQKELKKLNEQLSPLLAVSTSRKSDIDSLITKRGGIISAKNELVSELSVVEDKMSEVQAAISSCKENIVSFETRKQTLKEWDSNDPNRATINTLRSLGLQGIRGPISDIIRIKPGSEEIVTSALKDKLNYMIASTVNDAQNAVRYLEDNNLGRVAIIVEEKAAESVSKIPLSDAISRSLISYLEFRPEDERIIKFITDDMFVSGTTIYGSALIEGGGAFNSEKFVLTQQKLDEIDSSVSESKLSLSVYDEENSKLKDRISELLKQKEEIDIEQHKIDVQIEWFKNKLLNQQEEIEFVKKDIQFNEEDFRKQIHEEETSNLELGEIENRFAAINAEEQSLKNEQQVLSEEISQIRNRESELSPSLTNSKSLWSGKTAELSSREREDKKISDTITLIKESTEKHSAELVLIEKKIEEQINVQKEEAERLQSLYKHQEHKEKEVAEALSEREKLISELEFKTSVLAELRKKTGVLKDIINASDVKIQGFEIQIQNLNQRLSEDFSLSYEDAKDEYISIEAQEEEILRLKRRIENMGAVNLAAPEEYAVLEERYNFLLTQQQDLLKAREDMLQAITKINNSTRENFKNTYEQVRENFRNIYHQLFEGGEADLSLTDESNLLETGIEIFAQPPGKKFQNITLLSGGEKALTACALLFAFFMVKPSPFCILDEVDAPLDDANIGRFINMVKSFSDQSQFLMITHNKRSIESANVLYGITMEELGVSKIISVRLQIEKEAVAS